MEQPGASDTTATASTTATATRREPVRWRGWRPWVWGVLVAAATICVAVEVAGGLLIGFSYSSTCNEAPDPATVRAGHAMELRLMVACVVLWLAAAALIRPRTRVVVAGLLATAPIIGIWVIGFRTESWVGGFCF